MTVPAFAEAFGGPLPSDDERAAAFEQLLASLDEPVIRILQRDRSGG